MAQESFIVCDNLVKIYKVLDHDVVALQGLDMTVFSREILGIVGVSESFVEAAFVLQHRGGSCETFLGQVSGKDPVVRRLAGVKDFGHGPVGHEGEKAGCLGAGNSQGGDDLFLI